MVGNEKARGDSGSDPCLPPLDARIVGHHVKLVNVVAYARLTVAAVAQAFRPAQRPLGSSEGLRYASLATHSREGLCLFCVRTRQATSVSRRFVMCTPARHGRATGCSSPKAGSSSGGC